METVVLLSQLKQKPDDYINVTFELDDVDITSAETKATYDEIKKYVVEHNAGCDEWDYDGVHADYIDICHCRVADDE